MSPAAAVDCESFDVAYLVLSGTSTAARCPEILRGLVGLGFSTIIALPTPNAARVVAALLRRTSAMALAQQPASR